MKREEISFFGHFGDINLGNESTLQAILYRVREDLSEAGLTCICTEPRAAAERYGIDAISLNGTSARALWLERGPVSNLLRRIIISVPVELYRWFEALRAVRRMDVLIVPGTGLLTDLCGLRNWGPYNVFKWCVVAKLCRCKLLFVSVGAGPLYSRTGRWLARAALAMADYRSYRDIATKEYLTGIGCDVSNDPIYPDLAFSLPTRRNEISSIVKRRRPVVGLGLMLYRGLLSIDRPSLEISAEYVEALAVFSKWLLEQGYDVRLLSGDMCDKPVVGAFKALLEDRIEKTSADRILDEPPNSVNDLLAQLEATDIVVATRFHNVLLAILLNKPVLSISFHPKCVSLMRGMGLSDYSLDIRSVNSKSLIEQFLVLRNNIASVKAVMRERTEQFRAELDEQYRIIFSEVFCHSEQARQKAALKSSATCNTQ